MKKSQHEPLQYSSKMPKTGFYLNLVLAVIFGLLTLALAIATIYWYILGGDFLIPAIFCTFVVIVLVSIPWVSVATINRYVNHVSEFVLHENGIAIKHIHKTKNKVEEKHIGFDEMNKVLIGNLRGKYLNLHKTSFDILGVLLIIMHQDGNFYQRLYDAEELEDWLLRLKDKGIPIYYTEYDLTIAYDSTASYDVDFNQIEGIPWDGERLPVPIPLTMNQTSKPYIIWKDEKVEQLKEKDQRRRTKRAEFLVIIMLFLYALFAGAVIMPSVPLLEDNTFEFEEKILLGVVLVNMVIPFLFVYWRKYTKWYMPIVYVLVGSIGNCLSLFLFSEIPDLYEAAIIVNLFTLIIGWYPILLIVKICKAIYKLFNPNPRMNIRDPRYFLI
ncbi:hypothetical protein [Ornithinibacillus scapharcae]|uniref:hypothetical protein n=1 Tax=Ornithinibacillus scapharcae TaxID=1147159 RepID=UPI000225AAE3|nr:hypothetical protein [Ornithinibacillus scapharcae]